jgi:hypothetical protein
MKQDETKRVNGLYFEKFIRSLPDQQNYDLMNLWSSEEIHYFVSITFGGFYFNDVRKNYNDIREKIQQEIMKNGHNAPKLKYIRDNILLSEEQYLWASNMISTRSFPIKYAQYQQISKSEPLEINDLINKKHYPKVVGVLSPITGFINHVFPKNADFSDLHISSFIMEQNSIFQVVNGTFNKSEEYGFMYIPKMNCINLIVTYGFAYNPFDVSEHSTIFSPPPVTEELYIISKDVMPKKNYELCKSLK